MILHICDEAGGNAADGIMCIPKKNLNMSSVHMFIASSKWDKVIVDVDESISPSVLKYLPVVTENVEVNLPENMTVDIVGVLASLYPKKAGLLRRAFMMGGNVEEVLRCEES